MEVSVEVLRIVICTIYTVLLFLNSGVGVDDVLVRLSLIGQIIKDANLMCISFGVKHPQIFWKS